MRDEEGGGGGFAGSKSRVTVVTQPSSRPPPGRRDAPPSSPLSRPLARLRLHCCFEINSLVEMGTEVPHSRRWWIDTSMEDGGGRT